MQKKGFGPISCALIFSWRLSRRDATAFLASNHAATSKTMLLIPNNIKVNNVLTSHVSKTPPKTERTFAIAFQAKVFERFCTTNLLQQSVLQINNFLNSQVYY